MSLPQFSAQAQLFSTAALTGKLFGPKDRYRLMAQKVYPVLVRARAELERCYCADNGRVATEPVMLLGVSLLQYLEDVPDRQAVEMMRYHAGWNLALNSQLGEQQFHPTTLVHFRQRLLDQDLSAVAFEAVLDALVEAGLVQRKSRQRLDSTQMLGRVSRISRLECVRESLRLALREIGAKLPPPEQPQWWLRLWDRYVDSQTDYRASAETLARKFVEAGQDNAILNIQPSPRPTGRGMGEGTLRVFQFLAHQTNSSQIKVNQAQVEHLPPITATNLRRHLCRHLCRNLCSPKTQQSATKRD